MLHTLLKKSLGSGNDAYDDADADNVDDNDDDDDEVDDFPNI